jgi:hypothetical protein
LGEETKGVGRKVPRHEIAVEDFGTLATQRPDSFDWRKFYEDHRGRNIEFNELYKDFKLLGGKTRPALRRYVFKWAEQGRVIKRHVVRNGHSILYVEFRQKKPKIQLEVQK